MATIFSPLLASPDVSCPRSCVFSRDSAPSAPISGSISSDSRTVLSKSGAGISWSGFSSSRRRSCSTTASAATAPELLLSSSSSSSSASSSVGVARVELSLAVFAAPHESEKRSSSSSSSSSSSPAAAAGSSSSSPLSSTPGMSSSASASSSSSPSMSGGCPTSLRRSLAPPPPAPSSPPQPTSALSSPSLSVLSDVATSLPSSMPPLLSIWRSGSSKVSCLSWASVLRVERVE